MGALVMAWRCMVCMAGVLWWEFEGCEEDSRELECRVLKPKQSKQVTNLYEFFPVCLLSGMNESPELME